MIFMPRFNVVLRVTTVGFDPGLSTIYARNPGARKNGADLWPLVRQRASGFEDSGTCFLYPAPSGSKVWLFI